MKRYFLLFVFFFPGLIYGQDLAFGKQMLQQLTSEDFWGRGYTKEGMHKAAAFLADRFAEYGLKPLAGDDYFQHFNYSVNTFPAKMKLRLNNKELIPGIDFIVAPESKGLRVKGKLVQMDSVSFVDKENRFILKIENKLTWSVAPDAEDYSMVSINKSSINFIPSAYSVDIDNSVNSDFNASNICGFVKGTERPDSFLFITAHYDHLGGMGKDTYFPGANDNASGISLLLNLCRYYGLHPQRYSMAFILFAGEEIGLLGSKYFTEHPPVALSHIRFLTNTDLAGTGEEGITVVNATEFPKEFNLMTALNDSAKWLTNIYSRGKAPNSDHYYFSEKGVPAFFFYTMGGIKAYHDVFDKAETLPLNKYEALFQLMLAFNKSLMGNK